MRRFIRRALGDHGADQAVKRFLRTTLHRCEHAACWSVALAFTGTLFLFAKLNRWLED